MRSFCVSGLGVGREGGEMGREPFGPQGHGMYLRGIGTRVEAHPLHEGEAVA
jgi:hypothetical protein